MATLLLLAGGKSTRFGRPKQLEPVGPGGEALLDITLRDAFAAGCDAAVIVVRPEHEAVFSARYAHDPRIRTVVQHEALGTAHAVLVAAEQVRGTALIANADDHYGRDAIRQAMHHAQHGDPQHHALVAFELANTLSLGGGVNRAACTTAADGSLLATEEVTGLHATTTGTIADGAGRTWPGDTLVSMNLWVFRPALFPLFRLLFTAQQPHAGEFGLPTVVAAAIGQHHRFLALRSTAQWCGLTHPADADRVRDRLRMP